MFAEAFLAASWTVVLVTQDPVVMRHKLEHKGLCNHPKLLWSKASEQRAKRPIDGIKIFCKRVLRTILRAFESEQQRRQREYGARFLNPQTFKEDAQRALNEYPGTINLIFNMYVDGYLPQSAIWEQLGFKTVNGQVEGQIVPWAGLCITPSNPLEQQWQKKIPSYYALSQYRGTCFLDEAAVHSHRNYFPEKHFAFLPDITETDLPAGPNPIANEITRLAGGRCIVFMGGSIGKQKNIENWASLILNLDPAKWYFVQVGRINHSSLTTEDKKALHSLRQRQPQNLFIHPDYMPDETSFNAVIAAADVIFAVYRDFYRSSNMLSKAAYFEKPILVADRCLMGERVVKYGIGLAVPATNAERIAEGLLSLAKLEELPTKFANYRSVFSRTEFDLSLAMFATTCLNQK